MKYRIGYSFDFTIKKISGTWLITEIDKENNKYIITGISGKAKGIKHKLDITKFDKVEPQEQLIYPVNSKIIRDHDEMYVGPDKESDGEHIKTM